MACDAHLAGNTYINAAELGFYEEIVLVGIKNRWAQPTPAGWGDTLITFYFATDPNKHICELQLVHERMFRVRSKWNAHKSYREVRTALELLEATGNSKLVEAAEASMGRVQLPGTLSNASPVVIRRQAAAAAATAAAAVTGTATASTAAAGTTSGGFDASPFKGDNTESADAAAVLPASAGAVPSPVVGSGGLPQATSPPAGTMSAGTVAVGGSIGSKGSAPRRTASSPLARAGGGSAALPSDVAAAGPSVATNAGGATTSTAARTSLLASAVTGRTDIFLSHHGAGDHGQEDDAQYARVRQLNRLLRERGYVTWFDPKRCGAGGELTPPPANQGAAVPGGIDRTSVVIVFLTNAYVQKVAATAKRTGGTNATAAAAAASSAAAIEACKQEFLYSVQQKTVAKLIPVVMEASMRDTGKWLGAVGVEIGSIPAVDMADHEAALDGSSFEELCAEVDLRLPAARKEEMDSNRVLALSSSTTRPAAPSSPTTPKASAAAAAASVAEIAALNLEFAAAEASAAPLLDAFVVPAGFALDDLSFDGRIGKKNVPVAGVRYGTISAAMFKASLKRTTSTTMTQATAAATNVATLPLAVKVMFSVDSDSDGCVDDFDAMASTPDRVAGHPNIRRIFGSFQGEASVRTLGPAWHDDPAYVRSSSQFVVAEHLSEVRDTDDSSALMTHPLRFVFCFGVN